MASSDSTHSSSSSDFYNTLHATALSFVHSIDVSHYEPRLDMSRIRAVRTKSYTHSWGHNHFISTKPPFQGPHNLDGFMAHMQLMLPYLESVHTDVSDVLVDESRKMAVVRVSYWLKVKAADAVENDLLWWLWMDESGEKVDRSMEFLDAEATKKIAELIGATKK